MKTPLLLLLTLCTCALPGPATAGVSWTTLQVGKRPESITKGFDGLYYITVMGAEEPGDAVVKVIKGDQVEVFATGMDEPKGIAFTGEYLVTTDLKRVWKIDARGCASVLASESAFPNAVSYLNDAATAGRGRSRSVFITDMGARDKMMGPDGLWPLESAEARALPAIGRIYEIFLDGRVKEVVGAGPEMACPNGVCVGKGNRLLIAEFFHGNLLESTKRKLRVLNTGFRGGDGIVQDRRGNIYLSSWTQGKVWKLDREGKNPKVILEGLQSAADFYLDEKAGMLLVPDMKAGTVTKVSVEK